MIELYPEELNVKNIHDKVTEYSIWKALLPFSSFNKVGEKFKLRPESKGSAVITYYRNRLWLKDFGTTKPAVCWEKFVMEELGMKYYQALSYIANMFGLGFMNQDYSIGKFNKKPKVYKPVKHKEHSPTEIRYKSRKWGTWKIDKEYWYDKYQISIEDLELFGVKPLSHYWMINGSTYMFTVKRDNPTYMYKSGKYKKLYSPLDKDWKWVGNTPKEVIFGEHLLPEKGELLILESSLKDTIVTTKLGYNAIPLPSETTFITEEKLEEYKLRFNRIVCHLNNDNPGIEAAKKWKELYDVEYFYNPIGTPKDSSDFVEKLGYEQLKEIYKQCLHL